MLKNEGEKQFSVISILAELSSNMVTGSEKHQVKLAFDRLELMEVEKARVGVIILQTLLFKNQQEEAKKIIKLGSLQRVYQFTRNKASLGVKMKVPIKLPKGSVHYRGKYLSYFTSLHIEGDFPGQKDKTKFHFKYTLKPAAPKDLDFIVGETAMEGYRLIDIEEVTETEEESELTEYQDETFENSDDFMAKKMCEIMEDDGTSSSSEEDDDNSSL